MYPGWGILGEPWRWMCYRRGRYQRREGLDLWYGGRPTDPIGEVKYRIAPSDTWRPLSS
jgi:hypothetical protein